MNATFVKLATAAGRHRRYYRYHQITGNNSRTTPAGTTVARRPRRPDNHQFADGSTVQLAQRQHSHSLMPQARLRASRRADRSPSPRARASSSSRAPTGR
jgi:hypothetical protein